MIWSSTAAAVPLDPWVMKGTAARIGDICPGLPERWAWKDVAAPKPCPTEVRDDVVRVVCDREPGVTIGPIAKEIREVRKRHRLPEQENEVLRPSIRPA